MTAVIFTQDETQIMNELVAALMPMGMTPIEARVHALLTISQEPLTLDEMVDILGVSKSSASVAARELERHGAAHRVSERGTKRVRYGVSERNPGFLTAQVQSLGISGNILCKWADRLPDHAISARLRTMGDFYLHVRDALDTALKDS